MPDEVHWLKIDSVVSGAIVDLDREAKRTVPKRTIGRIGITGLEALPIPVVLNVLYT